ncbi:uncharacterized protein LACBIDRAFT_333308 [Laccaria bicolor S238N-H82]|uniref:Uncharacterized protein n=1 Tax=Laccaria bicolor (strain S238N-H82 / ATCC MYA-4686) TaxID=486041 RepID=B0DVJ1_LACBS|nr:uncharacterized protein LACBIDRAFT_333308 [Laccaria bicolor S238N-H82]EDR01427.1 hypothetical protein LACBIDRAFT_333308 [Laccaria bicolor S238N-H82]|eukprot:XP_001887972.1 hypothetical protein LACBIDRAFT_333308 [Laccaria bicolor S238N-H82]
MPHLTLDPNLEVSMAYDALCTALAAAEGVDKEAVIAHLSDAWNIKNNAKKATWDEQVRQDKAEEAEADLAREHKQQLELEERRKEEETERKEKEKKKPKLKNIAPNKLEGCTEASTIDRTIAQDAFTFTKADDTLLLKPMASHKPSNKAIPDEYLTWCQVSLAKTTLVHHMSQAGWPEHLIIMLAKFYLNLEAHPTRHEVDSDTVLLHYQAQVRREWHEALRNANDDEDVFDISSINDRRVDAIRTKIWNARRNEGVLRLEEQLAQTTLVTDPTKASRTHGQKQGRSPSPPPTFMSKSMATSEIASYELGKSAVQFSPMYIFSPLMLHLKVYHVFRLPPDWSPPGISQMTEPTEPATTTDPPAHYQEAAILAQTQAPWMKTIGWFTY